jgi:hypothetical protein
MTTKNKCKEKNLINPFLYATLNDLPQVGKVEFYIDGLVDISGLIINQPNILGKKAKLTEFYCPLYNKLYRNDNNKLKKNFTNFVTSDISKNNLEKIIDKTTMKKYIETTYFKEKTLNFSLKQIEQYNKDCIIFPNKEILVNNAITILKEIIFNNKNAKIFYKTLEDRRLERDERAYYLVNYPKESTSDISNCSLTNTNFICEFFKKKDIDKESPNAEKLLREFLTIKKNKFYENYNNKKKQIKNDLFGDSNSQLTEKEEKDLSKELAPYLESNRIEIDINNRIFRLVLDILNNNSIKSNRKQNSFINFLIEHLKSEKSDKLPNLIKIFDKAPTEENKKEYNDTTKKIYDISKTIDEINEKLDKNDGDIEKLKKDKEELQKKLNKILKELFEKLIIIKYNNILNSLPSAIQDKWKKEKFTDKYFLNEIVQYFDYFFEQQDKILNKKIIKEEITLRFKINEKNLKLVQKPTFREMSTELISHCSKLSSDRKNRGLTIKQKQIVNNCKLLCGYPNENMETDCTNNFGCNVCKPFVNCSLGTCIENQCPIKPGKKIKSVTNCRLKKEVDEEAYDDEDIEMSKEKGKEESSILSKYTKHLSDKYSGFLDLFTIKRKTLKRQQYPTKIFAMSESSGQPQVHGGKSKKNRYKLTIKKYRKQNKKTYKKKKKITRRYIKKHYNKKKYKIKKTIKR